MHRYRLNQGNARFSYCDNLEIISLFVCFFFDVFIKRLFKASIVLDTLVCMFSRYCQDQFTVEICEIETSQGGIKNYPILKTRQEKIDVNKINRMVGINEQADKVADLLTRMCLTATVAGNGCLSV